MNCMKRALLYIVRKKAKSAVIFLLMLVIATLALTGISIRVASRAASSELKQSLGGGFKVKQI